MENHEQCPRCGHNYFNGGSGLCHWCVDELEEKSKDREPHDYDNPNHRHNNCREDIRNGMSETERRNAANSLGSNWANIMSGLGDQ